MLFTTGNPRNKLQMFKMMHVHMNGCISKQDRKFALKLAGHRERRHPRALKNMCWSVLGNLYHSLTLGSHTIVVMWHTPQFISLAVLVFFFFLNVVGIFVQCTDNFKGFQKQVSALGPHIMFIQPWKEKRLFTL